MLARIKDVTMQTCDIHVLTGRMNYVQQQYGMVYQHSVERLTFLNEPSTMFQGFESYVWGCRMIKKLSSPGACNIISNTTGGSITFNTSIFKPDEQIELTCNVSKDTRYSIGKIIVNIVEGKPLNLYIE